eukprot:gene20333-1067_t
MASTANEWNPVSMRWIVTSSLMSSDTVLTDFAKTLSGTDFTVGICQTDIVHVVCHTQQRAMSFGLEMLRSDIREFGNSISDMVHAVRPLGIPYHRAVQHIMSLTLQTVHAISAVCTSVTPRDQTKKRDSLVVIRDWEHVSIHNHKNGSIFIINTGALE